jgi:hypothetical protein
MWPIGARRRAERYVRNRGIADVARRRTRGEEITRSANSSRSNVRTCVEHAWLRPRLVAGSILRTLKQQTGIVGQVVRHSE